MSLGWEINEFGWVVDKDIRFIKYAEVEELLLSILNRSLECISPFVDEMTDIYGEVKPAITPNIGKRDIPSLPSNRMILLPDFIERQRVSKTRCIYEFQMRLHYFGPEGRYSEYVKGAKNWNKISKKVCSLFSALNMQENRVKLGWTKPNEFYSDIPNQSDYDQLLDGRKRPLKNNIIIDTFSINLMTTHHKQDVFRKKLFDWVENLSGLQQQW